MEVALVQWPAESERRCRLHDRGVPRLLLVEDGFGPPSGEDCLEDWIRVPADDADVRARMAALSERARQHTRDVPQLDDDGVLRFAGAWVALPPLEVRLTQALLARYGAVAHRQALTEAGWPADPPARNVLDVHVLRLRRRILAVGLTIKTVRSRGYLLEASDSSQVVDRHA